jgi:hypothetical protein
MRFYYVAPWNSATVTWAPWRQKLKSWTFSKWNGDRVRIFGLTIVYR